MRIFTSVLFALLCQCLIAQTTISLIPLIQSSRSEALNERLTRYQLFSADAENLFDQMNSPNRNDQLLLKFEGSGRWDMTLIERQLMAVDFISSTGNATSDGLRHEDILTFGGYYNDSKNGDVALTLTKDLIYGFVEKDGHTFFIEPLSYLVPGGDKDIFVVYDSHDVIDQGGTCAAHEMETKGEELLPDDFVPSTGGSRMNCYILEIAIASDFSMFSKYGGTAGVDAHNFGVLNNVQTNYDDEFNEEIQFEVVTTFTSNCSTCDPWTASANAGTLLSSFRSWGNSGGFGIIFDVGELWTDRNIFTASGSGVIGVAYLSGICNTNKYHLLEDYTSSAWGLRVLTSHEIGHNFSSNHDAGGSGFIMAPSVNNTNTWSPNSISSIDNFVNGLVNSGCLSSCTISVQPVADFDSDFQEGCEPLVVNYFDQSLNNPTSWNWTFPGGLPSTSTQQNPTVIYSTFGVYDATLVVSNTAGTDVVNKFNYIEVFQNPTAEFDYVTSGRTVIFNNTSIGDFYFWDFGDNNISNNQNPIHTYIDDGIYTVTLTVENACGTVVATEVITIITAPIPDFSVNMDSICSGETVVFTDQSTSNTVSWNWSFPGGNPSTSNSQFPAITYNIPGTYDVSLEVSNSAGMNFITRSDFITVLADPIADFSYVLTDLTADFTNASADAYSYSWDFGDGNSSLEENPSHTYGAGGMYVTSLTAFGLCDTVTATETITISVLPVAGATADVTSGCTPLEVNFTDLTTSAPTSWAWTFPGGTPATSSAQNPTVTYSSAGTFDVELIATNSSGSDAVTLSNYVTVGSGPSAGFGSSTTGTTVDFNNTSSGANSYSWDFGDGNNSTDMNPTHDYGMDGTYSVMLTSTNTCGDATSTETIVIVTPPNVGATADVSAGCADLTVQFTDQSSANATAWEWQFPGGTPSSSTDQNPEITYTSAGTYDVTLMVSNSAGNDEMTFDNYIVVDDIPNADFSVAVVDRVADFTNTTSNGNSYSWDFGDGNSSTEENPNHTYAADGTYTVTLTATNGCGDHIFTRTINISNAPNAGATANSTQGCAPFTVQFTDLSSANTTSWNWTFPGGTPSSSSDQNPIVVYNNQGVYDVTIEAVNAAGNNSITLENYITVGEGPAAGFSSSDAELMVDFTNTSSNEDSYSWDFGDGNSSSQENPSHTYSNDGTYQVTLTVSNPCGDDIFMETITVVSTPSAGFTVSGENGCAPFVVQMNDQSSTNATSWSWSFPGGSPSSSIEQNPSVEYSSAGVYDVSLTVSNAAGSNTSDQQNLITVGEGPTANFASMANGMEITFTSSSANADSYAWDFGDGNTSAQENPVHLYGTEDIFTVTLTVTNGCGTDIFTNQINLTLAPLASFTPSVTSGCSPLTVAFNDNSSGTVSNWNWTFSGGTPSSSTDQNPIVVYNTAGIYDVSLTVSSGAGSDSETQVQLIEVLAQPTADFNTVFDELDYSFTNNSSNGNSYSWDFGDGNSSSQEDATHTYSMDGQYTVMMTVTNSCGSDIQTIMVEAVSAPIGSFITAEPVGCAPYTVTMIDQSSANVTSWNWTFDGGTPAISTEQNPSVTYSTPGIYTVALEVANSASTFTATRLDYIVVQEAPIAAFESLINDNEVTFTNNSIGGTTYSWDFGDGNSSEEQNPIHVYQQDGTFEVVLTVTNICGTKTETTTIVIDNVTLPSAGFSSDQNQGCAPFEVQFTNNSSANTASWNWTFPGGTPETSTDQNPVVSYQVVGNYSVTLVAGNTAGDDEVTVVDFIQVNDIPSATFSFAAQELAVAFDANDFGATTYMWNFGDGNTATGGTPSHTYGMDGTYIVSLEVTNACGTTTTEQEITVSIGASAPEAAFKGDKIIGCVEHTVNFEDASTNNPTSWFWTFPGGSPENAEEQNPTVLYKEAGSFDVTLMASNSAGQNTTTTIDYIVIDDVPTAAFDVNESSNGTFDFNDTSAGALTWLWEFGDGNSSDQQNTTHTYNTDGTYEIKLTTRNDCGESSITQTVVVKLTGLEVLEELQKVELFPNPTSDQFQLSLVSSEAMDMRVEIFNTIGQLQSWDEFFLANEIVRNYHFENQAASGTYFVKISSEKGTIYRKVILTNQ